MFSNGFFRVSIKAGKSCHVYRIAETNFKRYLSVPSEVNNREHDSSRPTARIGGRPIAKRMPNPVESAKPTTFHNSNPKANVRDTCEFGNDSEVFGSLTKGLPSAQLYVDEGDRKEDEYLEHKVHPSYKLSTKQYADMIKEHLDKKDLKAAIDVLQVRMIKEDQVKPDNYIYNLLIGACGRTGQAKQAFHLYNQMKKRSLVVTGGTYTALFNACATTVYPDDGLKRAQHLREIMTRKLYQPNATNYHAMIKAFGRCGDLKTAFSLVDEMIANEYVPTQETYNFLLQACVGDREAGFRHALLVWRKMRDYGVRPTAYTYNLMLRAVRDCGLGNTEVAVDVVRRIAGSQALLMAEAVTDREAGESLEMGQGSELDRPTTEASPETARIETRLSVPDEAPDVTPAENWPDLLAPVPHLGDAVSVSECATPQDRLLLLGGCSAFLAHMTRDDARPNIKTFTQLLDVIPGTIAAEKALMRSMRNCGIRQDTGFYNMLIKKRSMRSDYASARQVVEMMSKARLMPDQITFGVLALGCKTEQQAVQLLEEMNVAGFSPNIEILGVMLKRACIGWSFGYVMEMMETARRNNLTPNTQFYQHLDTFYRNGRQMIYDKERGATGIDFVGEDYFQKGYKLFCARYKNWLREMDHLPRARTERTNDTARQRIHRSEEDEDTDSDEGTDTHRIKTKRTEII